MKFVNKILFCSCLVLTAGCGRTSKSEPTSRLNQLVAGPDTACDLHSNNIGALRARYAKYVASSTDSGEIDRALVTYARIPSDYLEFVFTKSNARVYLTGQCQGGLTSWTYDASGRVPTTITSGTSTSNTFCSRTDTLAHEMGHASYGQVQRMHPEFEKALDDQFNWSVYQGGDGSYLADYARVSREEFFAELFDQYYCSAAARDKFKKAMPNTYAFAEKFLIAPK